jgi:hypothetical protein
MFDDARHAREIRDRMTDSPSAALLDHGTMVGSSSPAPKPAQPEPLMLSVQSDDSSPEIGEQLSGGN